MKLITLNTWGGRAGKKGLLDFFARHNDADIFCLQEIWSAPYQDFNGHAAGGIPINHDHIMTNGMQDISALLSEHQAFFRPHFMDNYGLLLLVKKGIKVVAEGEVFVFKERGHVPNGDIGNHARNIQWVTLETKLGLRTVINFHGLWNGKGKGDSEDRIKQSENIIAFMKTLSNPYLLAGDLNLLPTTQSLMMFEEFGLRNLIKEHNITSTRSDLYTKPEKFADYIFTSSGIKVQSLDVLPDQVSDHLALALHFV